MNEKQYNSEDQVILPGFRSFIKVLFAGFFNFLSFTEYTIRKKKWFIIAGFILGIAFGYLYFQTKKDHYKASMLVSFNKLTKKTYAEILSQLDFLASTGSTAKLAGELHVSEELASNIIYIDSKNINDEPLESDTSTRINQPFKIMVGILDKAYADSLQSALVSFLNNRPIVKRLGELDKKLSTEKLVYIDRQLGKLDTLTSEFNRFLATSKISTTVYNNAIDPSEIYAQADKLIFDREKAIKLLNIESDAIVLIDGFKVTMSPQRYSLTVYLLILGSIGLLLGLLFGLLIETKKKVLPESK